MLIVLLTLGGACLVGQPLLLWATAKVLRMPSAGIARVCAAFGLLLVVSLALLAMAGLIGPPVPILIALSCGSLALSVWLVKIVFRSGWGRALGCMGITIVANVAVSYGIKALAVEAFVVSACAMEPAILSGERILSDKITPRFRSPRRGEVVVFHPPHAPAMNFVKRVIGIEGDKLELSGDELLVNGVPAGECKIAYTPEPDEMTPLKFPAVVPPGKLFILGDKRDSSLDSRYWGFADVDQVIGLATMIYTSTEVPPSPGDPQWTPEAKANTARKIRWERIGKAID